MKKFISIIAFTLAFSLLAQGQVWMYHKNNESNPTKIEDSQLNFINNDNDWYISSQKELQKDPLQGKYHAVAVSAFGGYEEEYTVNITKDPYEDTKYWIHPLFLFGGLTSEHIEPVYGIYDKDNSTLSVPFGQIMFMNNGGYFFTDLNGNSTGNLIIEIDNNDNNIILSCTTPIGVPVTDQPGYWYNLLNSFTFTMTTPVVTGGGNNIALIDSISVKVPKLEITDYQLNKNDINWYWETLINFNYNIFLRKYGQSWFDKSMTYKAYDNNHNLVIEDTVDIYTLNGFSTISIPMVGLYNYGDGAAYMYDSFLPCDTAFQVAFSIEENSVFFENDSTITLPKLESYVTPDGERHGIVIDYYNERPYLTKFDYNKNTFKEAYFYFSEDVISKYVDQHSYIEYKVYRQRDNGKYAMQFMGNDRYLFINGNSARFLMPDNIDLYPGDIVALSCENLELSDKCWAQVTPHVLESSVDENGNMQGYCYKVEMSVPQIISFTPQYQREVVITYDREMRRGSGNITYHVYDEEGNITYSGIIPEDYIFIYNKEVIIDLPLHIRLYNDRNNYITLSMEEGAFVDTGMFVTPTSAVDSYINNDKTFTGIGWTTISDDFVAPYIDNTQKSENNISLIFNEFIIHEENMGNFSYEIYQLNNNIEFVTKGIFNEENIEIEREKVFLTLPSTLTFDENKEYIVLISMEEGSVTDLSYNKNNAIESYIDENSSNPVGIWYKISKNNISTDSFFTNGDYGFVFTYATSEGSQDLGSMTTFEYQGEVVLPGANWFGEDVEAQHFTISGFMADNGFITSNGSSYPMNGYVYTMVDAGQEIEMMTIAHDPVFSDYPCFGEDSQYGMQYTFWLASIEGQSAYPYVDFMVMEEDGIKMAYNNNNRVAIVGPHPQDPNSLALFADLEDLIIAPASTFEQKPARIKNAKVKWLDEPIKVKKGNFSSKMGYKESSISQIKKYDKPIDIKTNNFMLKHE